MHRSGPTGTTFECSSEWASLIVIPYARFTRIARLETTKCGHRRLHGRLSGAFICHVQRNRANAVAVFFYQVIKSLRVACCGDEPIAGFEYSLHNVSA